MPEPINGEYYTREDDVRMVQTPADWPMWPYLPLKRPDHVAGVMFGDPPAGGPYTVYLTNMWRPDLANAETEVYDTPEALVDAGWKVD